MTETKQSNRVTKADLAERDAQIAALQADKDALQAEIEARIAAADDEDRFLRATIDNLGSAVDQLNEIRAGSSVMAERYALVIESLAEDIESLFGRLAFAASTLSTIRLYGGDDLGVVHDLAVTVLDDVAEVVNDGLAEGTYASDAILAEVAEELSEAAEETIRGFTPQIEIQDEAVSLFDDLEAIIEAFGVQEGQDVSECGCEGGC